MFVMPFLYIRFRGNQNVSQFKSRKIQAELKGAEMALARLEQNLASVLKSLEGKTKLGTTQLLAIPDVVLKEAREGAALTSTQGTFEATTKTGTIGVGVTRNISVAASKGQTKGTLNQQSVTRKGADELTEIDNGKLIVTGKGFSFVGGMYTRNADFETILESEIRGTHLAIASTSYERTLIVRIPEEAERELADTLIRILSENSSISVAAFKKELQQAVEKTRNQLELKRNQ